MACEYVCFAWPRQSLPCSTPPRPPGALCTRRPLASSCRRLQRCDRPQWEASRAVPSSIHYVPQVPAAVKTMFASRHAGYPCSSEFAERVRKAGSCGSVWHAQEKQDQNCHTPALSVRTSGNDTAAFLPAVQFQKNLSKLFGKKKPWLFLKKKPWLFRAKCRCHHD